MNVRPQTLVGRNIRRLRQEYGLTIEELAFRSQLHPNYLGDVERGSRNPALVSLKKIADGLKRPLSELVAAPRESLTGAPSRTGDRKAVYFSEEDRDLLSLIKALRTAPPKDRKRIIQIARSLSARLKSR